MPSKAAVATSYYRRLLKEGYSEQNAFYLVEDKYGTENANKARNAKVTKLSKGIYRLNLPNW